LAIRRDLVLEVIIVFVVSICYNVGTSGKAPLYKQTQGGFKMKTRTFVLTSILVLTVLVIAGSCATRKLAVSEDDFINAYTGTWFNPERSGVGYDFQKLIVHTDGTWDIYSSDEVKQRMGYGDFTLVESWEDTEGTLWFRLSKVSDTGDPIFEYGKISNSGKTLEFLFVAGTETVKKWEPDNPYYEYRIYYRQE
jgi:hypothetical protein